MGAFQEVALTRSLPTTTPAPENNFSFAILICNEGVHMNYEQIYLKFVLISDIK